MFADDAPVARLVTTRATRILAVDATTAALLRRTSRFLVDKPLAVLLAVEDRAEFRSRLACLPQGVLIQDWHLRLHAPDGEEIFVIASVEAVERPHPNGGESTLRWSIVPAPAEVQLQRRGAAHAEGVAELIGDLVHELNQPLAAIVSFARGCVLRARAGKLEPAALETVMDNIVAEVSRASGLLRVSVERWRKER
jgi:signal transduction histidine kinase